MRWSAFLLLSACISGQSTGSGESESESESESEAESEGYADCCHDARDPCRWNGNGICDEGCVWGMDQDCCCEVPGDPCGWSDNGVCDTAQLCDWGPDTDCEACCDDYWDGCGWQTDGVCRPDYAQCAFGFDPDCDCCSDSSDPCGWRADPRGICDAGCAWGEDPDCKNAKLTHRLDVLLLTDVTTCIVGDVCTSGECVGLWSGDTLAVSYADNGNFRGLHPKDPGVDSAAVSECIRLTLSVEDLSAISDQLAHFRHLVAFHTDRAIHLEMIKHEVPPMGVSLTGSFWAAPADLASIGPSYLSSETEFVLVTHGVRDVKQDLRVPFAVCGYGIGPGGGLAGTGYSWVPKTNPAVWFECANYQAYVHEWLHQVKPALELLSGFMQRYVGGYPECGAGDPDTTSWFPDPHDCSADPDAPTCGGACSATWNQHVLRAHWEPGRLLIGNHCRDGVQDYSETSIDEGGSCL